MGNCKSIDATSGDQPDGLPFPTDISNDNMAEDVTDGQKLPTASSTREYLRRKSCTDEGQVKARVMQQIDFHTLLKQLHASTEGNIKQTLNDEIKLKEVQKAVKEVYDTLMKTVEGSHKAAVVDEVKSKEIQKNAERDIESIKALKASLYGVLKGKVTDQIMEQGEFAELKRQISADLNKTTDQLKQTGYGYQKLSILYKGSESIVSLTFAALSNICNIFFDRTNKSYTLFCSSKGKYRWRLRLSSTIGSVAFPSRNKKICTTICTTTCPTLGLSCPRSVLKSDI